MQMLDLHLALISMLLNNVNYKPSTLKEFLLLKNNNETVNAEKDSEIDALIKAKAKNYKHKK